MPTSKASGHWEGSLKDGRGQMKPDHGSEVAFSVGTRFEGQTGSNPEELMGAALAGCFSMALAGALGRAGMSPQSIHTTASVLIERGESGFAVTRIDLVTKAKVPGADDAKFHEIADTLKCPVSKALAATPITIHATLE